MRQQQLLSTITQIPDDIARLAHEQQLGSPQADYTISKQSPGWRWLRFVPLIGLLFFVGTFSAFMIIMRISPDTLFPGIFVLFMMEYVGLLVSLLIPRLRNKSCTLYPCDKGFILKQSITTFRVVRWDEIETIWYTATRGATQGYLKNRLYTMRCHDGYTLTFAGLYKSLNNLDKTLAENFTRRRLPFQFADYQAGQTLSFGPLSINREGIIALGKMLPWEQVADISLLKDRRLIIYKTGERPEIWPNLPPLKIANLSILLALFKRIHGGQSEQEAGLDALAVYGTAATIVQSRGKLDALPDGLAALAEEHQLGERRLDQNLGRSCLTSWAGIIALSIFDVILAIGTIIVAIKTLSFFPLNGDSLTGAVPFIEFALFGPLFIQGTTRYIVRNVQQIHNYTYTFERGMLLKRGQQAPVVYRWEDIAIIWRNSGTTWYNRRQMSNLIQSMYAHTLQLHNGDKYTLTRFNINQETLGKIIKEQIVPLQTAAIIPAFRAGQTITFGTVQTNQQGIAVNKRVLSWSQIKSVALQGNRLVIYDITQRTPWCRLPAERIPNLFLLFALADYARDITAH